MALINDASQEEAKLES